MKEEELAFRLKIIELEHFARIEALETVLLEQVEATNGLSAANKALDSLKRVRQLSLLDSLAHIEDNELSTALRAHFGF